MIRRTVFVVVAMAALLSVGCSDPALNRSEFVETLAESEPPVDEAISNCAFDELEKDEEILKDLTENGVRSDEISVATEEKLEAIVGQCIIDENAASESDEEDE